MSFLDPPTRQYSPRVVQVVSLIGVAASSFTITVLSAALPDIADDLDSSVGTVTWVIAGPLLAFAVFTPMAGKLGDVYGHRRMYLIGFSGAAIMSFATAAAWDAGSLIAFRILAQAFASSTGPSALALMMKVFPDDERTSVAGVWSAVLAASPAAGVVLGGPIVDATSWRALFLIQSSGMVVAVIAAARVLPATDRRRGQSFDLIGGVLLAAGVAAVLIPLNRAPSIGWDHPLVYGVVPLAPVFLWTFTRWERQAAHPLVELTALRERNVALPLLSQLFLNGPYMAGLVITSLMLAAVFDYETTAISLLILPRPIAFAAGAAGAGRLVERLGGRPVVVTGSTMVALGLFAVGWGALEENLPAVVVGVVLAGTGSGIARPPIIAALTEAIGDRDLGVGTGMLNMTGQIGAAAGISLLSGLVSDTASPERFFAVFAIATGVGLLAALTVAAIRYGPALQAERHPGSPTAPYSAVLRPPTRPRVAARSGQDDR